MTKSEKHIGTIAPDLFQNKVLIINYQPNKISVSAKIPKQSADASFQKYKILFGL